MNPKHRCALLAILVSAITSFSPELLAAPPDNVPADAKPFKGWKVANTHAWVSGNHLFIKVQKWPEDKSINIPRFANSIVEISIKDMPDRKIELQPEPRSWALKLGSQPKDAEALIDVELDAKPQLFEDGIVCTQAEDKIIFLPAKYSSTHGTKLRYEPQMHKNTVGYWTNARDTAEWRFKAENPGMYEVEILQGCGKGNGGSKVDILVEDQLLKLEVQDTGHFQNFIWKPLGTVGLARTNEGVLKIIPQSKKAAAVMDVRAVRIFPVGTERSMKPELVEPEAVPKDF